MAFGPPEMLEIIATNKLVSIKKVSVTSKFWWGGGEGVESQPPTLCMKP